MPTVDKTGLIVGIEASAGKITAICTTKEGFYHFWVKLQSPSIWARKKNKTKLNTYLSPQLEEWGNISQPAKMADLCNCQQIFLNLSFTSSYIPTTLWLYVVNITIWLCCLLQEKSDPYVLWFSRYEHLSLLSHPYFLFGFMGQHC